MSRHRLLWFCWIFLRLWIGVLLCYSGVEKLRAFLWWRDDILVHLAVVPDGLLSLGAAALPGIEVVTGAVILIGFWKRAAAYSALLLFGVFALSLSSVIIRGIDADCGCFGPDSSYPISWAGVVRNMFFMALCYLLSVLPSEMKEPTRR